MKKKRTKSRQKVSNDNSKSLFIFYTENPSNEENFEIKMDKSSGWTWIGAGRTYPINKDSIKNKEIKKPKYEREEQYMGQLENIELARNCLNLQLEELQKKILFLVFLFLKSIWTLIMVLTVVSKTKLFMFTNWVHNTQRTNI
jgi:hypothetical protein